jgi:acetyl-CoA carboxylase carboxyltransferase component
MGGAQAASTLLTVRLETEKQKGRTMTPEEHAAFKAPILEKYEREGSPYYSSARLWDDGVIDPLDTRRVISLGLEAAACAPLKQTHFGVFRM